MVSCSANILKISSNADDKYLIYSRLVKGKPRANTPTGLPTRNTTVKKEKEIFEQQKHTESTENINGNRVKRSLSSVANEMLESGNDVIENDENDDDEFSHDGYSHSIASMQSLPPTPEPRNVTPTQHHTTRPSSKTSTISMSSTSSPPPERKATSYINVRIHTYPQYIDYNFHSLNFPPSISNNRIQRHLVNSYRVSSIRVRIIHRPRQMRKISKIPPHHRSMVWTTICRPIHGTFMMSVNFCGSTIAPRTLKHLAATKSMANAY